jgi:lysozyme family protein
MSMAGVSSLTAANAQRWAVARMLTAKGAAFRATARRLVAVKDRYLRVAKTTNVPWHVVAVIHEREAAQRWDASIAQGDPWDRISTHIPKGRGPFASWEAAAIDALENCPPFAARWKDWSPGGTLTLLEQFNGLGYANMDKPSPYIWAGTDQYARGKYIADGKYDPDVVDSQLGCTGMLLAMAEIDAFVASALGRSTLVAPAPAPVPGGSTPATSRSLIQAALALVNSLFRRPS